MKSSLRSSLSIVGATGLGLLLATCGGDGGGVGVEPGRVVAKVISDGAAAPGVTLRLFASGNDVPLLTLTTASDGTVTFANVEPGVYDLEVELPTGLELATGEVARKSVTVSSGGNASVEFALTEGGEGGGNEVVEITLTASLTFSPSEVTIAPGTTVRWINGASVFHTITPDGHNEWSRVTMNQSGQTFEHTFENAGTFPYFCEVHLAQGMTGSITVQ